MILDVILDSSVMSFLTMLFLCMGLKFAADAKMVKTSAALLAAFVVVFFCAVIEFPIMSLVFHYVGMPVFAVAESLYVLALLWLFFKSWGKFLLRWAPIMIVSGVAIAALLVYSLAA